MRDLRDFIAVYDGNLSRVYCEQMIENFQGLPQYQMRNGAGIRDGLENSGWTELNVTALADHSVKAEFERLILGSFAAYNELVRLPRPISPIQKMSDLMMKRYEVARSDQFQVHFDSIRALSNRYLVFLWYLNDVEEGGETWFPDLDLKIGARAGRLLIFPPYWMFQHAGLPPLSGDKYIVSGYALY